LRKPKDETETSVLRMMETTVLRMAGLIDNVLDFARGRLGGGITLSRDAKEPLQPVLQQVVDELRVAMPDRVTSSAWVSETAQNGVDILMISSIAGGN
ncbi:MAG: hypothetical protein ABI196_24355, partial [Bradyrhizobium sp.]